MTAGDDTAPPAGPEHALRAAGYRTEVVQDGRLDLTEQPCGVCGETIVGNTRAGDTAPGGLAEVRETLQDAIDECDSANAGRITATGEELWQMQGAAELAMAILTALGPAPAAAPVSDTSSTLRHLAGELRDGPPAWLPAGADSSWRTEVAAWLEHHATQHPTGAAPDGDGRAIAVSAPWIHDLYRSVQYTLEVHAEPRHVEWLVRDLHGRLMKALGERSELEKRLAEARPAATIPAHQHFLRGDRVETGDGDRATVTGPAPRGPRGELAVNLDWDGDAGGPAYEHDLTRVPAPAAGRDLTAQDVEDAYGEAWNRDPGNAGLVAEHLTRIARPAVARTDGGKDDAEVWIPPAEDCMNHQHEPCPHCSSRVFHHRTGRCGSCGRRPGPAVARTDGQSPADEPDADFQLRRLRSALGAAEGTSFFAMLGIIAWDRAELSRLRAVPADDTAAPDRVAVPRVHLRSWGEFLRALVQQDAIRTLNARDAVLDNARQIESWAGQPVRDSQDGGA